jgi:hypothetical protein
VVAPPKKKAKKAPTYAPLSGYDDSDFEYY